MRVIIDRIEQPHVPLLRMYIHDAPHRRQHRQMIKRYREVLRRAFHKAGLITPYDGLIDLSLVFINPTSPDYDNLLTALYQALDGKALGGNGVLTDDENIWTIHGLRKLYTT